MSILLTLAIKWIFVAHSLMNLISYNNLKDTSFQQPKLHQSAWQAQNHRSKCLDDFKRRSTIIVIL